MAIAMTKIAMYACDVQDCHSSCRSLILLHLIKTTVSDLIRNTAVCVTINYLIEDLENP